MFAALLAGLPKMFAAKRDSSVTIALCMTASQLVKSLVNLKEPEAPVPARKHKFFIRNTWRKHQDSSTHKSTATFLLASAVFY
mmetsp:Transcript_20804/g.25232  ORF Transcript_20804/g.25232 Transcript_20804/m.25232 type:complete len:83 (-) Transcript_20804:18-266(-)